jgi:formate/nitrite transporter FocA (FNT family)
MAVELFKRQESSPLVKVVGIIICVGGFVVSGFEHCIADMFYLSASGLLFSSETPSALLSIVLGSSGNILGAFAAWYVINFLGKKKFN